MAFIIPFLERLAGEWGRATDYVTGDGGEQFIADLRPERLGRDAKGLTKAIVRDHGLLPSSTAERIMGLEEGALQHELEECVRGYPEEDPVQKAVHFKLYERGRKWLFEGEDRNRCFMWQFSPFYSLPMVRLAMEIPDHTKRDAALYIEFHKQLNPTLAHIPNANFGLAIDSVWLPAVLRARRTWRRLPTGFRAIIRTVMKMRPTGLGLAGAAPCPQGSRRRFRLDHTRVR